MRRARLVPFVAVAAALVASKALAQTVTARVGGNLTGFPYTPLTVPIVVDMSQAGGATLGSYTARLSWNPAVLDCYSYFSQCGMTTGSFPAPQLNTDSVAQGVLRFTAISPVGAGGLVTLAQFQLEITDTTASPLSLGFSEMSAAGTFTNLLPSLSVSGGTFCMARGHWADLDNDGSANSRDALVILSNLVGLPVDTTVFKLTLGDADGDALVNSRDALIILSYAVGLDIPGQRVLLPAATCGAGSPRQITVFPATASIAPSQTLQLFAQATDSAGGASAVPTATWRSSDYSIATVDGAGLVTPRSTGVVTITADVSPGLHASAIITVLGRRANWYVDVRATGAPLELGSQTEPFEHPSQAFAVAGEGDTIRVAQGTYYWTSYSYLNAGVVLIGGTPGDTTTRPVFRDPENSYTALQMNGGQRTLVRNVVFDGFSYAADLNGVRSFAMEDSKVVLGANANGYGVYTCSGDVDSIRVDRSAFVGDSGTQYGYGVYADGCGRVGLLTFRDSKIRFMEYGLYLYEADSTAVIRSEISDNDGYGIYLTQENVVRPALYLAHSRVERNYYEGVYLNYARRLVADSNVVRATEDDGFDVYGASSGGLAQVYLHGDSIYQEGNAEDYAWLYTDYVDSLVVDRTIVRLPADTSFYTYADIYADKAFVTNSKFLNQGNYSEPFYFSGSQVLVDNVDMTGCAVAGCDLAHGFQLYAENNVLNSEVRNSRFTRIGYPVFVYATNGTNLVHGLVLDSVNTGIEMEYGDSVAVYGNVLTRVTTTGMALSGPATLGGMVAASNVSCSANPSAAGVSLSGGRYRVQGDTMTSCTYGIETIGAGRVTADQNVIRNGSYGIWQSYTADTSLMLIRGNGISGTQYAAVYVNGRPNLRIVGNNLQNNLLDAVSIPLSSGYITRADSNAFVGNGRYGVYAGGDSVDARDNWWGSAGGPGGDPADTVFGRVNTSGYLAAAPSGLPGLAPPVIAAAPRMSAVDATTAPPASAPRPARIAKRPRLSAPAGGRLSPEQQLRLQRHQARQAEREAQKAARQTTHAAEQQRRAQAAAGAGVSLNQ